MSKAKVLTEKLLDLSADAGGDPSFYAVLATLYVRLGEDNKAKELFRKMYKVGFAPESIVSLKKLLEEDSKEKQTPKKAEENIGRNDPCPCGSGLKFKRCCGRH